MSDNKLGIKVNIAYKLEKYAEGVSQDDIDAGRAVPYEVIDRTEETILTKEQAEALGLKKGE